MRYFIDSDKAVWTIDDNGQCNYPGLVKVEGDVVEIVAKHQEQKAGVDPVLAKHGVTVMTFSEKQLSGETVSYPLFDSLMALSLAQECNPAKSDDGSLSMERAVYEVHQQAESFKRWWSERNKENPDFFPMSLPSDNAGLWFEQIFEHGGS